MEKNFKKLFLFLPQYFFFCAIFKKKKKKGGLFVFFMLQFFPFLKNFFCKNKAARREDQNIWGCEFYFSDFWDRRGMFINWGGLHELGETNEFLIILKHYCGNFFSWIRVYLFYGKLGDIFLHKKLALFWEKSELAPIFFFSTIREYLGGHFGGEWYIIFFVQWGGGEYIGVGRCVGLGGACLSKEGYRRAGFFFLPFLPLFFNPLFAIFKKFSVCGETSKKGPAKTKEEARFLAAWGWH